MSQGATKLTGIVAAVDTDTTLAANSDVLVASQKAVKAYVDAIKPGRLLGTYILTSASGTHTVGASTNKIEVEVVAGGGGGGGITAATNAAMGGGGAGGGYAFKTFTVTPSTGYSYTVGAAGTGGDTTPNNGNTGGDSTFTVGGTTVTAKGGLGGVAMATGTSALMAAGGLSGGVSTNGDINMAGDAGLHAHRLGANAGVSGKGGNSPFGAGGAARIATVAAGAGYAGTGYGAGGSGGLGFAGSGSVAGGDGTQGVIVVREYSS